MKKTRLLSLLLVLAMLLSALPSAAFAVGPDSGKADEAEQVAAIDTTLNEAQLEQQINFRAEPASSADVSAAYTRFNVTFDGSKNATNIENGSYLLMRATDANAGRLVSSNNLSLTDQGFTASGDTILNPEASLVWKITLADVTDFQRGQNYYFQNGENHYLTLVSSGTDSAYFSATTGAGNLSCINIIKPSGGSDVAIGRGSVAWIAETAVDSVPYMSLCQNGEGAITTLYLYRNSGYIVNADCIASAQDDVKSWFCYTAESWESYANALAAAKGTFETEQEAMNALDTLRSAKENLHENGAENYVDDAFTLFTPSFADAAESTATNVTEDVYVLVRASGSNSGKAVSAENLSLIASENETLGFTVRNGILTAVPERLRWNIVPTGRTSTENGKTRNLYYLSNAEGKYLGINSSNVALQDAPYGLHIIMPNGDTLSGVTIGKSRTAWIHESNNAMSTRGQNSGDNSNLLLYKRNGVVLKQSVLDDAVKTVINDSRYYTPATWKEYHTALANAGKSFPSYEAAKAALEKLNVAVTGLIESGFECIVFNSSKQHNMTWTRTVDAKSGETYTPAEGKYIYTANGGKLSTKTYTAENYVPNVYYVNQNGPYTYNRVTYDTYEAVRWNWSDIAKLVNDQEDKTDDVWVQNENGNYYRMFSRYGVANGADGITNGANHNAKDWFYENFYKISGTFTWPKDYDLFNTTVSIRSINDENYGFVYDYVAQNQDLDGRFNGNVIPVNDDVYAVMWAEAETIDNQGNLTMDHMPTADTMDRHLLFWTGTTSKGVWSQKGTTANDWSRTAPATFLSSMKQGVRAFRNTYPNMATTDQSTVISGDSAFSAMRHTDGWYTITDVSAINSVLRANYPNGIPTGTKVHLDLYLGNNSSFGMIDELEIELTKEAETKTDIRVEYYVGTVDEAGYLGTTYMMDVDFGAKITLLPGVKANELDHMLAAAIAKAGNKDMASGVQLGGIPFVVTTNPETNVIRVLYVPKNDAVVTYDFGVENVYDVFSEKEKTALECKILSVASLTGNETPKDSVRIDNYKLYYTPKEVNRGVQVTIQLTYEQYPFTKTVTIYPASNVWYDDDMFTLPDDNNNEWTSVSNAAVTVADNDKTGDPGLLHGYTAADLSGRTGAGKGLTAVLTQGALTKPITASFWGTGFDLIADCGTDTGMLLVAVKNLETNKYVRVYIVDTYYSETHGAFQVPVVRNMDLTYGHYGLEVQGYLGASAGALLTRTPQPLPKMAGPGMGVIHLAPAAVQESPVDRALRLAGLEDVEDVEVIYMDDASILNDNRDCVQSETSKKVKVCVEGFRVYQPLGANEPEIYTTEKENGTAYKNAYDFVAVSTNELSEVGVEQVFLYVEYEGPKAVWGTIADYKNQGPHNELYLAGQGAIAFAVRGYRAGMTVQVSAKAVAGTPKLNGTSVNGTEMYYNVEVQTDKIKNGETIYYVLLKNTAGDNDLLSISAVKYSTGISTYGSLGLAETLTTEPKPTEETPTFTPDKLTVSSRRVGKATVLSITADTKVKYLVLTKLDANGNPIAGTEKTLTPTNSQAVTAGRMQNYTFTVSVTKGDVYQIVAYSGSDNAHSAPYIVRP